MKIIGKDNGGFILTATERELMNICGFHYFEGNLRKEQAGRSYNGSEFVIGDTIQVTQQFEILKAMQSHDKKLTEAKAMLQAVIASVELVRPVVKEITAAGEEEKVTS